MNIKKLFHSSFDAVIFLFLFFAIIPFLIISIYVNPCWDDFEYSEIAYQNGFFQSQNIWYQTWSGRYFSTAVLSALNPLLFRSILGYKIIILVFILLFLLSVYFLVSEIGKDIFSKKEKLICTLSFCYLIFYGMPTITLALFWFSSAVIYQLANTMTVVLILLLIKFNRYQNQKISFTLVLSICLLIFAIEGSNEVTMLTTTLFFVILFMINIIHTKKLNKYLFIFAAVSLVSFALVYSAPGNNYRLSTNPESHQLIFSIKNSIIDLLKFIMYRIYNLPLLIFTVLFVSFYSKHISIKKPQNILNVNPVLSLSLYLLILFSGIFVSYYSLGTATPFRTLNVIYVLFLAGWFINIIIIINYFYAKRKIKIKSLPGYAYVILSIAVLFSFARETNSIKVAYKDLLNGTAQLFDSELKERYRKIYSDTSDTCEVDSLTAIPKSFFYYDIGSDPDGKYNKLQSQYFDKKFIIRKK
ncbi:MAG: DUF6056 family protein [Bacteroidota bacterium]|nr:DUF6056 family protein [Bacteroidota bacterium]